ncbi:MAG: hypothetical protein IT229_00520 [Flavobacteriales bacterium]|nr:hypothetical protein [Flavobacteriales bacterium]
MKLNSIAFAIALLSGVSVSAQTTPTLSPEEKGTQPMSLISDHACMMDSDAATWSSLSLNAEQLAKVEAAQASCKSECTAMKEAMTPEKKDAHQAEMERHAGVIQTTLTTDQYAQWQKWCAGRSVKTTK